METQQVKHQTVKENQLTLAQKNINQNLIQLSKKLLDKDIPACISNDNYLTGLYKDNDLEFTYVFDCCKSLKPLKGVDINLQQVEFWFKEFIRNEWTKKIFDKQFEAIKRATLFNRIDLENWLRTEIMYSENDFNIKLNSTIKNIISDGRLLNLKLKDNPNYSEDLTELEKTKIELYCIDIMKSRITNNYYELTEKLKYDKIKELEKMLNVKTKQQIQT